MTALAVSIATGLLGLICSLLAVSWRLGRLEQRVHDLHDDVSSLRKAVFVVRGGSD